MYVSTAFNHNLICCCFCHFASRLILLCSASDLVNSHFVWLLMHTGSPWQAKRKWNVVCGRAWDLQWEMQWGVRVPMKNWGALNWLEPVSPWESRSAPIYQSEFQIRAHGTAAHPVRFISILVPCVCGSTATTWKWGLLARSCRFWMWI